MAAAVSAQWHGPATATANVQAPAAGRKRQRGACTECRAAKMRCTRPEANRATSCDRCDRLGRSCIVELSKLGRKKGSVNKFTSLNRALRQAMERQAESGAGGSSTEDARTAALSVVANLLEGPSTLAETRWQESRQSHAPVIAPDSQINTGSVSGPVQSSSILSTGGSSSGEAYEGSSEITFVNNDLTAPNHLLALPNTMTGSQRQGQQWIEERSNHPQTGHPGVGDDDLSYLTRSGVPSGSTTSASDMLDLGDNCNDLSYYIDVSNLVDGNPHTLTNLFCQPNEHSSLVEIKDLAPRLEEQAPESSAAASKIRCAGTGENSPIRTAHFGDPLRLLSAACHSRSSSVPLARENLKPYRIAITAADLGFGNLDTLVYSSKDSLFNLAPSEDLRRRTKLYFSTLDVNKLEAGNDAYDPISIGLLTRQEAESLLDYFYTNIGSMTLALDPHICDIRYLRNTSPFLLTAVCMVAARYDPTSNHAVVKRLSSHYNLLLREIREYGFRSASIIHGLLLGSGWTEPAQRVSEEVTWSIYCLAVCLATQLGLHTTFSSSRLGSSIVYTPSQIETDFCPELSGPLERGKRLLRHGERCWLHLFIWATGAARTMNRPWLTPFSDFTPETVRVWHLSQYALAEDMQTIAIFELRRILHVDILPKVTGQQGAADQSERDFTVLKAYIDHTWEDWHITWLGAPASSNAYSRTPLYQPYPALQWKHHRVLSYSTLLEVCKGVNLVHAATCCLKVALEVVRHVVKELTDGTQLRFMVNNVALMSLYSALCVVKCVSLVGPVERSARSCIVGLLETLANILISTECNMDAPLKTINFCGHHLNALLETHVTALFRDEAEGGYVEYEVPSDPPRHFYDEYMSMYLNCLSYGSATGNGGNTHSFFDIYEMKLAHS